jgi:hypothetical protein
MAEQKRRNPVPLILAGVVVVLGVVGVVIRENHFDASMILWLIGMTIAGGYLFFSRLYRKLTFSAEQRKALAEAEAAANEKAARKAQYAAENAAKPNKQNQKPRAPQSRKK